MTTQTPRYTRAYRLKRLASCPPGTCMACYKIPAEPDRRKCTGCLARANKSVTIKPGTYYVKAPEVSNIFFDRHWYVVRTNGMVSKITKVEALRLYKTGVHP